MCIVTWSSFKYMHYCAFAQGQSHLWRALDRSTVYTEFYLLESLLSTSTPLFPHPHTVLSKAVFGTIRQSIVLDLGKIIPTVPLLSITLIHSSGPTTVFWQQIGFDCWEAKLNISYWYIAIVHNNLYVHATCLSYSSHPITFTANAQTIHIHHAYKTFSWSCALLHATFQHNNCTSSRFPVTLWSWVNIRVIQTGIEK